MKRPPARSTPARRVGAGAAALLLLLTPTAQARAEAEVRVHSGAPLVTRRDAVFALAAGTAVTLAAFADRAAEREARGWNSAFDRDLARGAEHFGNPAVLAPALLAVDG